MHCGPSASPPCAAGKKPRQAASSGTDSRRSTVVQVVPSDAGQTCMKRPLTTPRRLQWCRCRPWRRPESPGSSPHVWCQRGAPPRSPSSTSPCLGPAASCSACSTLAITTRSCGSRAPTSNTSRSIRSSSLSAARFGSTALSTRCWRRLFLASSRWCWNGASGRAGSWRSSRPVTSVRRCSPRVRLLSASTMGCCPRLPRRDSTSASVTASRRCSALPQGCCLGRCAPSG